MKKYNYKNKKAFSIPELLIIMVIVGVISVMMLTIIKPNESALKFQYYNAYNTLNTAAFNINQDAMQALEENLPGVPAANKRFPINAKELCEKLASNGSVQSGYINTTDYRCDSNPKVAASGDPSTFIDANMAFRASNSMKFYIRERLTTNIPNSLGGTTSVPYFLVWVDLNGDRGPNTSDFQGKKKPDIVPFVVADYGYVLPVGGPVSDITYMTGRVKVITDKKTYYTNSMPYYAAQIAAYGNKQYPATDLPSVANPWRTILSGTKAVAPSYPGGTQLSDCSPPTNTDLPPCSVEVDIQKGL